MNTNQGEGRRTLRRTRWHEWIAFFVLVLAISAGALTLGIESTRQAPSLPQRNFLAVAHWFDPVFFQYNLLMAAIAVLIIPLVTLSYVVTMADRKQRRLNHEIPESRREESGRHLQKRTTLGAYAGSVTLTTLVVLLGASIILLFKPVSSADELGVDFSRGANVLLLGPFIQLFGDDFDAFFFHLTRSLTAFQFGFLGAYVYFIGVLARAYFTLDLTPQTFIDGTIRMISASVLALVMSFAIVGTPRSDASATDVSPVEAKIESGDAERAKEAPRAANSPAKPAKASKADNSPGKGTWDWGLLPVLGFTFGFFPKSALLAAQRLTQATVRSFATETYRALPLSMLEGMSYVHELRLEREGLDNIENLSTADPVSLAVCTGFSYAQLERWVSAAWLATHLREHYPEFVRCTGITTGHELWLFTSRWDRANGDAFEQLTKGVSDAAVSRILKVKLSAVSDLLAAAHA